MYTVCNPSMMMPAQQMQMPMHLPGQIYYTTVPTYFVNGAPPTCTTIPLGQGQGQHMFYQPQAPTWYSQTPQLSLPQHCVSSSSDDDVFIQESTSSEPSVFSSSISSHSSHGKIMRPCPVKTTRVVQCQTEKSSFKRLRKSKSRTRRKLANTSIPESLPDSCSYGSPTSDNSLSNSGSSCHRGSSPGNQESSLDANRPPFVPNKRPNALQQRLNNDLTLCDVFSASLCSAINEDPPTPTPASGTLAAPKTSSPISDQQDVSNLLKFEVLANARGRLLTSVGSERSLPFSQNGLDIELENTLLQTALDLGDPILQRREEFLKILEQEREKQRKCVLPKNAPKLSCKFCKNNGESPDVYTKHRVHYNEKTVCPLLRHYVCRLCNSTGDFAHTIKHCPFNSRNDRIAWKATFL